MIIIVIIAALVCLLVLLIVVMALRGRVPSVQDVEELNRQIQPVEVFELLALADRLADLRRNGGGRAQSKQLYREVRTDLLRQVKAMASNAAIILRIAQFSRRKSDGEAADLAEQLINDALSVRLLSFALIWRLHTMFLFPRLAFKAGGVIFFYQRLLEHLSWLPSQPPAPVALGIR